MFVDFFIRRPVFAMVTAMLIVLVGAVCIPTLPIAQFPLLAPPTVTVTSTYVGASAQAVESAVTIPIEEQINGAQGLRYLTSTSSNNGLSIITATFDIDRDQDLAAVDIQNRVSQAQGRLPNEVKQAGVIVNKGSTQFVCAIALSAKDGAYSNLFISNYADVYIKDAIKRVPGVSDILVFGERRYSMRLWLDPVKLAARKLTATDVLNALREQNLQVAAGTVGAAPAAPDQSYEISVRAMGRLQTAEEFGKIILKTGTDGTLVLLQDVGRAELGAEDYSTNLRYRGKETIGLGVLQLPSANALDVDKAVRKQIAELSRSFPPGLEYEIPFDPTTVVGDSISEVVETLGISILLVVLVIFVFLQSFRSTLIPAITIPVSLIGTFGFVKLFDFSINTLTLFGLTLATGLVVDDAIVVIENIERHIRDDAGTVTEAASLGMREVTGAVIATSLVLIAVFVPVSFFPGTTGRLYKQFSLTIAFSVAISAFNAVTLTPSLSALLLRKHTGEKAAFFRVIERGIDALTRGYQHALHGVARARYVVLVLFLLGLGATYWLFNHVPSGFVPEEDDGYFVVVAQGPEGSSLEASTAVAKKAEAILLAQPEVHGTFGVIGYSFSGSASNKALIFVPLEPISQRKGDAHSVFSVIGRVAGALHDIPGALVFAFPPPPIQGLGNFGGFSFEVLDRGAGTLDGLAAATNGLVTAANSDPKLSELRTEFGANDPQLLVQIDRQKAKGLNVSFSDISDTLQVYMGSEYVNDFDFNNRSYRVYVQADQAFRGEPKDLQQFYVRTGKGTMLPLQNLISVSETSTPQVINHYNLFRSAEINGNPGEGVSSGQALTEMEALAKRTLPLGMGYEWTGLALEQLTSGRATLIIFSLALLFVFLVLAAQYESFVLPFIILLAVPLALLGALGAQSLRGLVNDVYCQIGLVMLVGLASKNAILIVEFAEQLRAKGLSVVEAAIEASRERLRPILMTSLAFILGLVPLVFASGAGSNSRHSLGTAVSGGMIVSTVLNLFVTPVLYILVQSLRQAVTGGAKRSDAASQASATAPATASSEVPHA